MSTTHSGVPASGSPTIIGLDLSLTSTGMARIGSDFTTVTRVTSRPTGTDSDAVVSRLASIVSDIRALIPVGATVAVEGPAYGRHQGQHVLGGLWWMVRDMLAVRACDVLVVPPSTVKKYATGKGNAQKDAVLAAAIRRYPEVNVTGNDEADALVLAAIAARHDGHPVEDSLPQTHIDAMKGLGR